MKCGYPDSYLHGQDMMLLIIGVVSTEEERIPCLLKCSCVSQGHIADQPAASLWTKEKLVDSLVVSIPAFVNCLLDFLSLVLLLPHVP